MTSMKKLLFIILAVLFIATGIDAKPDKKTYWKNGKRKTEITYYKNGKLKSEVEYHRDGIAIIKKTTYWKNGNLRSTEDFQWAEVSPHNIKTYYKNGKLKTETVKKQRHLFKLEEKIPFNRYCYKADGKTEEKCKRWKHGCTKRSKTCIKKK